jgi:hypothetical protein
MSAATEPVRDQTADLKRDERRQAALASAASGQRGNSK